MRNIPPPSPASIATLPPYASARMLAKGEGWTFLDANECPEAPDYDRSALPDINRYPDPTADALREAIGERFGLVADQVFCACGIDQIIDLVITTFSEPGNVIVSAGPTFPLYRYRALVQARRYAEIPLTEDWQLPDEFCRRIPQNAAILFLCTPNNPTGTTLPAERIAEIANTFPGLVIVDEAYGEFADANDIPSATLLVREGAENLIVCRTFSKAYRAAGLRLGYALGNASLISRLQKTKLPYNVNAPAQTIGLQLWRDRKSMEATVRTLAVRTAALAGSCRRLGCEIPRSITNFFLLRLPNGRSGTTLYETLRDSERILVRPSGVINGRESLRVTTGTPEENSRFLSALTSFLS
ncbi:MAG: histidinol-phosphate transaminase [Candidatus Peribacteraceae bacterium]